jgi:hypothetical protein
MTKKGISIGYGSIGGKMSGRAAAAAAKGRSLTNLNHH